MKSIATHRGARWVCGWTLLGLLAAIPAQAGLQLREGMAVEIGLETHLDGRLVADDLTLLQAPRSLKLRGELRAVDLAERRVRILDWEFDLALDLELVGVASIEQLQVGTVVEVGAESDGREGWVADEIDASVTKRSWKVKGTLTRIEGDRDDPIGVEVEGLWITFVEGTDLRTLEDHVAEDLFRVIKEEDKVTGDGASTRRVGPLALSGSLRHDLRRERDLDLRSAADRDQSEPSLRLELLSDERHGFRVFSQLRWLGRYELGGNEASPAPAEYELEVRQLYLSHRQLFGLPLGLVVGKQRLQDEREFLFDDYLDAARLYYHGARPFVFELTHLRPVAPLSDKFEDWYDWLAQTRWYLGEDWKARIYGLWRDDRSSRGRDVRYQGLALHGRQGPLKLWLDAVQLRGWDKGRRQESWSMATGFGLRAREWPLRPSIWASYAVGSGDENPDDRIDQNFRQTGYEDNSSRVWGIASFQHFGELLDPELSNLRVLSAGVAVRPRPDLSVEFIAHRYALDALDDEFDVTELELSEEPLDGVHRGLGHEFDLVVAWRDVFEGLHLVGRAGRFAPGEAFATGSGAAWLQRLELRWDF